MKTRIIILSILTLVGARVYSQTSGEVKSVAGQDSREFALTTLHVQGEVQSPVDVDFRQLPLRTVSLKEFALDSVGNGKFKGAFSYSGYALYDILSMVKVAKKNEADFKPSIDLYVFVGNDKGEESVFSWGEIFFAKDNFRILIGKSVKSINPSKMKASWALPTEPRLVCAGDLSNARFIDNPTRVAVFSYSGSFPAGAKDNMFSPTVSLVAGRESMTIGEINSSVRMRSFTYVGYGHGMGYKGLNTIEGFSLKEVVSGKIRIDNDRLRHDIVVVSSKDGYRSVFSASEIWNRNDLDDILLIDRKDSQSDGRYSLLAPSDFFVDRNVKAVERVQILR